MLYTSCTTAEQVFEMVARAEERAKSALSNIKNKFDADWERDPSRACQTHSIRMAKAAARVDVWREVADIIAVARANSIDDDTTMVSIQKLLLGSIIRHSADDSERPHEVYRRLAWVEVAQSLGILDISFSR